MTPQLLRARLLRDACASYRPAGRFAYHFARGKLARDPLFMALLERGWLAQGRALLDLGCGQGLLLAWLLAARDCFDRGEWPAAWPTPPCYASLRGVELMESDALRARRALQNRAQVIRADLREAALHGADTIVLLDVLHYLPAAAQETLLARVHAALRPGGLLLLRIGDAAGGLGFRISTWIDRATLRARGHSEVALHCRPLLEWQALLQRCGFHFESAPLSQGTPFANVLLLARPARLAA